MTFQWKKLSGSAVTSRLRSSLHRNLISLGNVRVDPTADIVGECQCRRPLSITSSGPFARLGHRQATGDDHLHAPAMRRASRATAVEHKTLAPDRIPFHSLTTSPPTPNPSGGTIAPSGLARSPRFPAIACAPAPLPIRDSTPINSIRVQMVPDFTIAVRARQCRVCRRPSQPQMTALSTRL
jgi:hypothetical protein